MINKIASLLALHYDLQVKEVKLLQDLEDQVYQVTTFDGKCYKFRSYAFLNGKKANALSSIQEWIIFLSGRIDVPFPSLVTSNRQENFVSLSINKDRQGSLTTWIDWKVIPRFDVPIAFRIGQHMLAIHTAARAYQGDTKAIKRIDANWMSQLKNRTHLATSSSNERQRFNDRIDYLARWLDRQGDDEESGIIHADLHPQNILQKENKICLIDFDDAVHSAFLLDLAILVNEFDDLPDALVLQKALLAGYGLTLTAELQEQIYYFQRIADLMYIEWVFGNSHFRPPSAKVNYGRAAVQNVLAINY